MSSLRAEEFELSLDSFCELDVGDASVSASSDASWSSPFILGGVVGSIGSVTVLGAACAIALAVLPFHSCHGTLCRRLTKVGVGIARGFAVQPTWT